MWCALVAVLLQADAPSLELARAQLAALKFEPVLQTASAVLEAGGASAGDTAELHFIMGQAAGVLGHAQDAQASFARALELQPGLVLPPGASPRIAEPFHAAQRQLGGQRLSVSPSSESAGPGLMRIRVRIEGDPLGLVARGVVLSGFPAAPRKTELAATSPPEAAIACEKPPCAYAVVLSDLKGNTLLQAGSQAQPLVTVAPELPAPVAEPVAAKPVVAAPAPARPFFARPWPYLVGAGVLGAVAGVFGWRFADAQGRVSSIEADKAHHLYAELLAASSQSVTWRAGLVTFATLAAALALVAVIVW